MLENESSKTLWGEKKTQKTTERSIDEKNRQKGVVESKDVEGVGLCVKCVVLLDTPTDKALWCRAFWVISGVPQRCTAAHVNSLSLAFSFDMNYLATNRTQAHAGTHSLAPHTLASE